MDDDVLSGLLHHAFAIHDGDASNYVNVIDIFQMD